jgi:hypothetical protein
VTGFAKLEYPPGDEFMRLFARACTAMQLEGFEPQHLANVMNGEATQIDVISPVPERNI